MYQNQRHCDPDFFRECLHPNKTSFAPSLRAVAIPQKEGSAFISGLPHSFLYRTATVQNTLWRRRFIKVQQFSLVISTKIFYF